MPDERCLVGMQWNAAEILAQYRIPKSLHSGLEMYLKQRIRTGGFLEAVLKNDLAGAVVRMQLDSDQDYAVLLRLVRFLTLEASGSVWGSPEKVETWLRGGG